MSLCPNTGKSCDCQPQDGQMCPYGPQPPFKPWESETKPRQVTAREHDVFKAALRRSTRIVHPGTISDEAIRWHAGDIGQHPNAPAYIIPGTPRDYLFDDEEIVRFARTILALAPKPEPEPVGEASCLTWSLHLQRYEKPVTTAIFDPEIVPPGTKLYVQP